MHTFPKCTYSVKQMHVHLVTPSFSLWRWKAWSHTAHTHINLSLLILQDPHRVHTHTHTRKHRRLLTKTCTHTHTHTLQDPHRTLTCFSVTAPSQSASKGFSIGPTPLISPLAIIACMHINDRTSVIPACHLIAENKVLRLHRRVCGDGRGGAFLYGLRAFLYGLRAFLYGLRSFMYGLRAEEC